MSYHAERVHHTVSQIDKIRTSDATKGMLLNAITDTLQTLNISLESTLGTLISDYAILTYKDKSPKAQKSDPIGSVMEAAWFVLTDGKETINTLDTSFPSAWSDGFLWSSGPAQIVSSTIPQGSCFKLIAAKKLVPVANMSQPIAAANFWSITRYDAPGKEQEQTVVTWISPTKVSQQEVESSNCRNLEYRLIYVYNPLPGDLKSRRVPADPDGWMIEFGAFSDPEKLN